MSSNANALNLSMPGNPRYQPKSLKSIFGYDKLMSYVAQVEVATLEVLGEIGVIPPEDSAYLTSDVIEQLLAIRTTDVDHIERTLTKHDIRAWIRCAQEIVHPCLRRWIHVPLTSYDALDTARSLMFVRVHREVLRPLVLRVINAFSERAATFASQLQIGRTHGQHALPITVGFWFATILSRVVANCEELERHSEGLVGKISGAVGAYNAQVGLGMNAFLGGGSLEERILAKCGLKAAPISTQILPPEPLAYYLFSCTMLSASLAQFGRDCRNLMRTEIAEIGEPFAKGQVGSSTMAHKRNPITFENIEGMWWRTKNEFGKVLDTFISEHQRDLVGSCVARDFPAIVINVVHQLETLMREDSGHIPFITRISVDAEKCNENFLQSAHVITAEPWYIALQMAGYPGDAHELINHTAVPLAKEKGYQLSDVMNTLADGDEELSEAIERIPFDVLELLGDPERYIGNAVQKTAEAVYRAYLFCSHLRCQNP
ncbi:hypothetical protein HY620_00810 [Candidatus Uhrbacteria bacterium]|nr:hypothetical protein [Candidatus Uhrbacteria bacterium]